MRNPSLLLLIVVFILAPFKLSAAADTVVVRETRIPVLIERQDNELFHLRIEAPNISFKDAFFLVLSASF